MVRYMIVNRRFTGKDDERREVCDVAKIYAETDRPEIIAEAYSIESARELVKQKTEWSNTSSEW